MKSIWKFEVVIADAFEVKMPAGSDILYVGVQRGTACIWALVDPDHAPALREFRIFGTGHPMDDDAHGRYCGTVPMSNGLVWHFFDMGEA